MNGRAVGVFFGLLALEQFGAISADKRIIEQKVYKKKIKVNRKAANRRSALVLGAFGSVITAALFFPMVMSGNVYLWGALNIIAWAPFSAAMAVKQYKLFAPRVKPIAEAYHDDPESVTIITWSLIHSASTAILYLYSQALVMCMRSLVAAMEADEAGSQQPTCKTCK